MLSNISNNSNYNQSFTSEVRVPYSTSANLTQYTKKIQKSIYKQLKNLELNNDNNLVNITIREDFSNSMAGSDMLGLQILNRRGQNKIYASPLVEAELSATKVDKNGKKYLKVVNIGKLYESAKNNMRELCNDNMFSRFI